MIPKHSLPAAHAGAAKHRYDGCAPPTRHTNTERLALLTMPAIRVGRRYRLATMCVEAAFATVDTVLIETTAPRATNAAKIASRIRELRWRIAMLSRWLIDQLPFLLGSSYKRGTNFSYNYYN